MGLVETLLVIVVTAVVNGAVTWGVVSTKLDWLRADVDHAHRRIDLLDDYINERLDSAREHQR